ncbi:DUF6477 family protein [Shimia abyssi]|uniref:Uncharacterized protein n=1 Tax=Shimia abyssi TaxID=1662395 RepID=A0A2P8F6L6_9RHOB|nr:DUF6477 family protein [Shimia abyssi]PSL17360.1 hypothetical protein CLV88_11835 [Shimia abyssi]
MQDILTIMNTLRRPRLLIRAARAGVAEYQREQHLKRHLGYGPLPRTGAALMRLIEMESELNRQRRTSDAAYSLVKHVDILIAMMGEARILRATQARP